MVVVVQDVVSCYDSVSVTTVTIMPGASSQPPMSPMNDRTNQQAPQ